ncbi:hypothetical protein [Variovorax paradoxus]|uniref:hypothetical protein n=1 Tax=Variovorax paradoxus TaxID=34073 RepID=UPI0012D3CAAA|nr:hypothetical protein [Variovorax paradoxus]
MSAVSLGETSPETAVNQHALLVVKAKEELDAAISAFFHSRYIPEIAEDQAKHRSAMLDKALCPVMREIYRAAP